jgi:hypothetical protein
VGAVVAVVGVVEEVVVARGRTRKEKEVKMAKMATIEIKSVQDLVHTKAGIRVPGPSLEILK